MPAHSLSPHSLVARPFDRKLQQSCHANSKGAQSTVGRDEDAEGEILTETPAQTDTAYASKNAYRSTAEKLAGKHIRSTL